MIAQCANTSLDASLLERLGGYVECHADAVSRAGFGPAQGGALTAAILTGCLVIYVALIGYKMMLGQSYDPRAALLAALRAGVVIALCASWTSYQPMAQALVLSGPAQIAGAVAGSSDLELHTPAQVATLLQGAPRLMRSKPPAEAASEAPPTAPPAVPKDPATALLISAAGPDLALRLTGAILLGLGPLLIPFALFDTMLGLVEGWIRSLLGVLLGSAAILILSTLEFGFIQSEMASAATGGANALNEQGLGLIVAIFAMAGWISLVATGAIAWSFRFRRFGLPAIAPALPQPSVVAGAALATHRRLEPALSEPARARSVAQAVIAQGQRERASRPLVTGASAASRSSQVGGPLGGGPDHADTLGGRRTPVSRRPVNAPRRERRS